VPLSKIRKLSNAISKWLLLHGWASDLRLDCPEDNADCG
jgi:hypothetical protein